MKITIGNSTCWVESTPGELMWLRELLTFVVPGAQYSNLYKSGQWDGKKRMLNYLAKTFPIGLLPYVLNNGKTKNITMVDKRRFPPLNSSDITLNTIELRDYQVNAIQACIKAKNCLIEAATNAGKCYRKGTKVIMFDGTLKSVEDIVVGDQLIGPDSQPRNVLALGRGKDVMYEVCPSKGIPFVVNGEHILPLHAQVSGCVPKEKKYEKRKRVVLMKASDCYNLFSTKCAKYHHYVLFRPEIINFKNEMQSFCIDPYFFGLWLGDGNSRGPAITTADLEIKDVIYHTAQKFGLGVRIDERENNKSSIYYIRGSRNIKNPMLEELRRLHVINNKHIPIQYKIGSEEDRLELLAGLIDSDGYLSGTKGYEITQTSKILTEDIAFVARSLGFGVSVREKIATIKRIGFFGKVYRIGIWGACDKIPVKILYKKVPKRSCNRSAQHVSFRVNKLGIEDFYGFVLDGDHLHLVEDFTVQHNTAIFSGLIKMVYPAPTLVLTHRVELLKQTADFIEQYTGFECGIITANDILIKPVTVAMITTLVNRIGVDQEVTDFFESLKCVIQDEVHHAQAKQFTNILAACPAPYRWGFSGTIPPEKDYTGVLVRQYLGPVVFKISNDELIDLEVSAKPNIRLYETDVVVNMKEIQKRARDATEEVRIANEEEERKDPKLKKKGESYYDRYFIKKVYDLIIENGIIKNTSRNIKAVDIITGNPGKSTLIVVDYLEHGRIVENILKDHKIPAVFISGQSAHRAKSLKDFKAGKLKVLIATSIVDEGLDINRVSILILLAGKKSRRQLLQRIGRSLRRKEGENVVSVYDFVDIGNKYLLKHSKERLAIYKAEQFDVEFV